uniref:Ankyrin repeat and LEM domain-containing protein 2 n=3 Tax=Parascaris TaxID=6254 RepID=A0A915B3V3_PARUN
MSDYFGVFVPSSPKDNSAGGAVFTTLKEASEYANTPDAKSGGARFKRFTSLEEAKEFAECGCITGSPFPAASVPSDPASPTSPRCNEPTIEFPSVSRIQQNRLKKAIETHDSDAFDEMVCSNPRYIINTSGDTPAIVVEGCRYNALHIAARVGNLHVVRYVIDAVRDIRALAKIYGTSEKDAKIRSEWLLDSYLNTPDKGALETPLHFASKFGHLEVVRVLLELDQCEKNPKNKNGELPVDICCSRASPENKNNRAAILALFSPVYVPLYRPEDNSSAAIICRPGHYPPKILPGDRTTPFTNSYILAAVAGPFMSQEEATSFHDEWIRAEREIRLSDPLKGNERIGRTLAHQCGVRWMERWRFSDDVVDLNSTGGLEKLNAYLVKNLLVSSRQDASICKKLVFDDEIDAVDEDHFEDSVEMLPSSTVCINAGLTSPGSSADSSLGSFIDRMAALNLNSDGELDSSVDNSDFGDVRNESGEIGNASDDEDLYRTPPSSPPESVYLCEGIPSKEDNDLILALQIVDPNLIRQFGAVSEYVYKLQKVALEERSEWPSSDSPRAKKRRQRM